MPEAEGGAARILAEANAYREQTILEAKGQTQRYNQIYDQYKKAPGVTRERMYLETMEKVLGPMDKTVVDFEFGEPARALYRAGAAVQDDRSRQMRRSLSGAAIAIIAVVAIILVWTSTFVVDPTEQALVLRFGQPVRDLVGAPGLYFKMPFIDTAVYIDKRILALDDERQEVLVSDNQRLEVDAFVRYRIADPLLFYQSVPYRAQGSQQSQQIKAEADRKVTVITAQAQQQSEQIRGEGDGERNRIFAEAYGADPEFFAFYRSMQAYQNSFNNGQTRALISPKSDFFRFFSTPTPPPEAPSAQSPAAQSPAAAAKAD